MADIISIDGKLDLTKNKKEALIRKRKIQAVQKVFQCTHCVLKCEKCGTQLQLETPPDPEKQVAPTIPYRFCDSCRDEYLDYLERLQGRGDPECYWHNEEWLALWQVWIEYQGSIDRYLKSKEFVQLLNELKESRPDP